MRELIQWRPNGARRPIRRRARFAPRWLRCVALVAIAAGCSRGLGSPRSELRWIGTWSAPPQLVEQRNLPPPPGLSRSTLRQVVHVSIGGARTRLRFSNVFGTTTVMIRSARLAASLGRSGIDTTSSRALLFDGRSSIAIPSGRDVTSDPIDFEVAPLSDLTVSIHFGETSVDVTGHPGSRTTSYVQAGDLVTAPSLPEAATTERWYILSGVDVLADAASAAVVTLGNSITDGRGSGTDRNNRWPDNLARRLHADARTRQVAVLNGGIGGNAVLRGGLGPTALERLDRDVLEQHGVRWLIVLAGVNDIGGTRGDSAARAVADQLIAAYGEIITRARRRNVRAYGATILPFGGSQYDDPARESARRRVNDWIRSSGAWDAVIDVDAALRDPANPSRLRGDADTGDHLHPNEHGHYLMAAAIDLALFVR